MESAAIFITDRYISGGFSRKSQGIHSGRQNGESCSFQIVVVILISFCSQSPCAILSSCLSLSTFLQHTMDFPPLNNTYL